MKLTKQNIATLRYAGERRGAGWSRDVRWDPSFKGFGVRVFPSGRSTFVLSYRVAGRKRLLTLGSTGSLSLKQARAKARDHLAALALHSTDPLEARERERRGETVRDLVEAYMTRHAKPRKRSWKKDERHLARWVVPKWGTRKAVDVKRSDVAALHGRIGAVASPYVANRVLAVLSKMFECALAWGYLPEGAANPARRIEKFPETKRDRWVTPAELPRLVAALEAQPSPFIRAAVWLYLLTGLRKAELLALRWEDVDLERGELRLAQTKAGRIHYLPLSAPAATVLSALPRIEGNPFVLPGRRRGTHLQNINHSWQLIRAAADLEDVRLHDLRRTVGSWLAQEGASLHLVGRVLNQTSPSTTAIYARFSEDHVRAALEAHGRRLLALAHAPEQGGD